MQTRLQSAAETAVNYIVGFILAWFIMHYLLRWMGYDVPKEKTGGMVTVFTVVSVIRSYAIRRLFNWLHFRTINKGTLIHPYDTQYRR